MAGLVEAELVCVGSVVTAVLAESEGLAIEVVCDYVKVCLSKHHLILWARLWAGSTNQAVILFIP